MSSREDQLSVLSELGIHVPNEMFDYLLLDIDVQCFAGEKGTSFKDAENFLIRLFFSSYASTKDLELDRCTFNLLRCARLATYIYTHKMEGSENDWLEVMRLGALKHGVNTWLTSTGPKAGLKDMYDSMFHHLAEGISGSSQDQESGLHPYLHFISRCLMLYTRMCKGLVN
jgi:hypothetical protein